VDKREDRYKKIYEKKKITTPEELSQGFPGDLYSEHMLIFILMLFFLFFQIIF